MRQTAINILKEQHDALLESLNQLREHAPPDGSRYLAPSGTLLDAANTFIQQLSSHLDLEDRLLYLPIRNHPDPAVRTIAREIAQEIQEIRRVLSVFSARLMDNGKRHDDLARHVNDLRRLLVHRIGREEDEIFPLLDAGHQHLWGLSTGQPSSDEPGKG